MRRFMTFRKTSFGERAEKMKKAATILRDEARSFAETMTREMGKPIRESLAEVKNAHGYVNSMLNMRRSF